MSTAKGRPERSAVEFGALGGKRRAEVLSPEERSAIASAAARARWGEVTDGGGLPVAEHVGVLEIGSARIPCAVLSDERRVLTEHGITTALGSRSGASKRRKKATSDGGAPLPIFLAPSNLKDHIPKDLTEGPLRPIRYRYGRQTLIGYEATVLRHICQIWLEARRAGKLQEQQLDRAMKAELLLIGLADTAIIALVDEATGYQYVRDRKELQHILSAYISQELLPWTEKFPQEFYKEMFRLYGWQWPPAAGSGRGPRGPRYAGKLTKQVIYGNLPPGVLEELERLNPPNEKWQRKGRHAQYLTQNIGHPHLDKLVAQMTLLFRLSKAKDDFWGNYKIAFPKSGDQLELLEGDAAPEKRRLKRR